MEIEKYCNGGEYNNCKHIEQYQKSILGNTKYTTAFIWNNFIPKIKNKNCYNSFEEGDLKNVDINSEITSLECSWIKQLYKNNLSEWKLVRFHLIKSNFRKNL